MGEVQQIIISRKWLGLILFNLNIVYFSLVIISHKYSAKIRKRESQSAFSGTGRRLISDSTELWLISSLSECVYKNTDFLLTPLAKNTTLPYSL